MILNNTEPKKVLEFFEMISAIPRASKKEKQISDFLVSFAKERNLEVHQNDHYNVIIKKPGTKGYETSKPLILQAHMDMVAEKNASSSHNFDTDGIKLQKDGNILRAADTTLGADNGIGLAMIMAVLDSKDIDHPPLEALITSDEEEGMSGVGTVESKDFKARRLINLDSEEEGKIYVSCAGGSRIDLELPIEFENTSDLTSYEITVRGLFGGHSGMEIQKQRGNSNKLLAYMLEHLHHQIDFRLISFEGGNKENAIPREATAIIAFNQNQENTLAQVIDEFQKIYAKELHESDPKIKLAWTKQTTGNLKVMNRKSTCSALHAMMFYPNGVKKMSLNIEGLVQTSSNLGAVHTQDSTLILKGLVRSSVNSELKAIVYGEIQAIAETFNGTMQELFPYPAWEYAENSVLREVAMKAWRNVDNQPVQIEAIHAGLENGILGKKFDFNIDMISIGPNIHSPHTPNEHLELESTHKVYRWLIEILKNLK